MPPVVVTSAWNGVPALVAGRLEVVIANGSAVVWMLALPVADLRFASVTFTTNSNFPAASGFH
jgi:hypothetical protein